MSDNRSAAANLGCATLVVAPIMMLNLFVSAVLVCIAAIATLAGAVIWWFSELLNSKASGVGSQKMAVGAQARIRDANTPSESRKRRTYEPSSPATALPPPTGKGLDIYVATQLCHNLLGGVIDSLTLKQYVTAAASRFDVASNHDIAALTAVGFFKSPSLTVQLQQVQLMARMRALEWFELKLLSGTVLRIFEDELYATYS